MHFLFSSPGPFPCQELCSSRAALAVDPGIAPQAYLSEWGETYDGPGVVLSGLTLLLYLTTQHAQFLAGLIWGLQEN